MSDHSSQELNTVVVNDDDEESSNNSTLWTDDNNNHNNHNSNNDKQQQQNYQQKARLNVTGTSQSNNKKTTFTTTTTKQTTMSSQMNNENTNQHYQSSSYANASTVNMNDESVSILSSPYQSFESHQQEQQEEQNESTGMLSHAHHHHHGGKALNHHKKDYEAFVGVDDKDRSVRLLRIMKNIISIGFIMLLFSFFVGIVVMIVQVIEFMHRKNNAMRLSLFLQLDSHCMDEARLLNDKIRSLDANNAVDLRVNYLPQITLFDAQFLKQTENDLVKAVKRVVAGLPANCEVKLSSNATVPDVYALWWVEKSECLQLMSDRLVNRTQKYIDRKSRFFIPDWVKNIPDEKTREAKIQMIKLYGSANVFSQFDPHVVLGYDLKTRFALRNIVSNLAVNPCSFNQSLTISIGTRISHGLADNSSVIFTGVAGRKT